MEIIHSLAQASLVQGSAGDPKSLDIDLPFNELAGAHHGNTTVLP